MEFVLNKLTELLKLLSHKEFISGQTLAASLSVSRSTISSWVQELTNCGIDIYSIKGRGYRLAHEVSCLNDTLMSKEFTEDVQAKVKQICILPETQSTNSIALEQDYKEGEWKLVATEYQLAGRGRRGREWISPPFKNLMFSLGHRATFNTTTLYCSSIIAGLSIVDSLTSYFTKSDDVFKIKWPNDIYAGDKKIAGILCELKGSPLDESLLVIGVGINVQTSPDTIEYPSDNLASIFQLRSIDRSAVLGRIVNDLISTFDAVNEIGASHVLSRWVNYDYLLGKPIKVHKGSSELEGVAHGIDEQGQLVVLSRDGRKQFFNGGEVSIRWR